MSTSVEVLARYRELGDYCDALAQRVRTRFGAAWQCRAGCSGCCQLSTVCGLEAVVLLQAGLATRFSGQTGCGGEQCGLLREERCLVYEHRPLICRTHGLPLVSETLTGGEVDCCPLNLPALAEVAELEMDLVLDLDRLTENLMRLNLAFFLVLGRPELAEARFSLASLVSGENLPPELLAAAGIFAKPPRIMPVK
jgi:Fe-S-cluster containining protein